MRYGAKETVRDTVLAMTDHPTPEEAPEEVETDESVGEKIQHGAQELADTPVIREMNDAVDKAEEFLGEKLHLHHHHDDANETEEPPAA